MTPIRLIRKKIGDLLIERQVINPQQLAVALEEQKKKGGYLSQHLIAFGFATELDIATCISNQYNFAYLPLKNYAIPPDILELVPLKWIKIYMLLPIDRIGNVLSVAMADPLNEGVIQMLQQICNCEVMVFISTYSELEEAINRYFGEKLKDLEKYTVDFQDVERVRTLSRFIQTKVYTGPDRREYARVRKALDIFFYYYARTFPGKTKDISFGGVSFISDQKDYGGLSFFSDIFMPINTSIACKIHLRPDRPPIDVVINVLRVHAADYESDVAMQESSVQRYEISGVFEFITNEDKGILLSFLKENLSQD